MKLIKLKILLPLCLLSIVLISILPSTSMPFVPIKTMAQKVPDNTAGSGGGSSGDVKPNDNSGASWGNTDHHIGTRRSGSGGGSGGTPHSRSQLDQGPTSQFSTSSGQPCIDPLTEASICSSIRSNRYYNSSGIGSVNVTGMDNITTNGGRPQRHCPEGQVQSQLIGGPPCVPYSLAVGPSEGIPSITLSCDTKNNLLVRGEGSGFVASSSFTVTAIVHQNNNAARDIGSSTMSDETGHLLLINPAGGVRLSPGRYTLVVDEVDPNNAYQATGHTYSISFDLPLDCGKLLTLNFTRGAGGVPPEIRRVEVPPADPAGIDGHCLPGQEERGSSRGTVCISPGYAVIISCKQISYHDALVLGIEPLEITSHLYMFAPTITIGNYHRNVYWLEPDLAAPPGLVGACFSPISITAGTHFAINEALSPRWRSTTNEDCQGTAVASRVYICTLINTYRPSMYLPKK